MADSYYIPADGLYHWNPKCSAWERLNRTIQYKGCTFRSVTYHLDYTNPKDIVNHKEWRITFPDGSEGHFGSVKRGGSLKELKEYIDFKEKYGEL